MDRLDMWQRAKETIGNVPSIEGVSGTKSTAAGRYHHQRDLAELPEPRFIQDTPRWLRLFVLAMASFAAALGAALLLKAASGATPVWGYIAAGVPVTALAAWLLAVLWPGDWRRWIVLAADTEGIYFVGRRRRVVFAPWRDVHDIAVETRITGKGEFSFAKLRLSMPEANWSRLSRTATVNGDGVTRSYTLPAVARRGEEVAAALRALRDGAAAM